MVKSKPVKQEASCTVILTPMVSVLCGLSDPNCCHAYPKYFITDPETEVVETEKSAEDQKTEPRFVAKNDRLMNGNVYLIQAVSFKFWTQTRAAGSKPWSSLVEGDEQLQSAQHRSNNFACVTYKNTCFLLVLKQPSSPTTKELHV